MKNLYISIIFIGLCFYLPISQTQAQIYEPEGINMPGNWDNWDNPPTNLVLANPNQSTGGMLIKYDNAIPRWVTSFNVAATGGDLVGGDFDWLFTSGPDGNYFQNKWASVDANVNELQTYTFGGADDNTITLDNGFWYTMVWEDIGYADCRAIFMKTSVEPVNITTVSEPTGVVANQVVDIDFTISGNASSEEYFYLQYSTDAWGSSSVVNANVSGINGTVSIPGLPESTVVEYNVFSSTINNVSSDGFLYALRINDDSGDNYSYTIGTPPPDTIGWCNLQWPPDGEILPNGEFIVYGQAFIYNLTEIADSLQELQAWIGYHTSDTDPSTWTNWIPAYYFGQAGDNDEYSADLGSFLGTEGTYYYATRYKYPNQEYVYGGYSAGGGDFWDGVDYVSGILTVTNDPTPEEITWANLQWPADGEIEPEQEFMVFGQVYIENITSGDDPVSDLEAWIGYSTSNTDPATWTNWISADFSSNQGNNDEYEADLGAEMDAEGTFYYATRYKYLDQEFKYGGYSDNGGNFWDGTDNISGVLTVTSDPTPDVIGWANLQWPPTGEILPEEEFIVYGQAWIDGVTSQSDSLVDLQSWIGYSATDTDPATWTNWIPAYYLGEDGDNDEYTGDLGSLMSTQGTFYYATRFKYLEQEYVYGGYSDDGGGFWNGTDYVSGILTVTDNPAPDTIGWCNLQWPPNGSIEPFQEFIVYGQAWVDGVTNQADSLTDLQAWIGYSVTNTNPAEWTEWIPAWYEGADGDNDEYTADLGAMMDSEGTYYYATRFKYPNQDYVYGGYSDDGGDFWDGTDYVNGVLTVQEGLVAFPVPFNITDATGLYTNIKLKGDMTNWNWTDMVQDGADWSVTLDIFPGTYEWGVLEDDGSTEGIWLVIGDNLVMSVDETGTVTGQTSYTVTFVGLEELSSNIEVYPNPVKDMLWIQRQTEDAVTINIMNVRGELIKTIIGNTAKTKLDLSDLASGMYFIQFSDGQRQYQMKIIKE